MKIDNIIKFKIILSKKRDNRIKEKWEKSRFTPLLNLTQIWNLINHKLFTN